MRRRLGQASEPIADEYFRIRRRLRGEIGTLTRQVEADDVLALDPVANLILGDAQQVVEETLDAMDRVFSVEGLLRLERRGIVAVRTAQRELRNRKESLLASAPVEPGSEPPPVEPGDGGSGPVVTESDSPATVHPMRQQQASGFPWGWFVGGVGLGMVGLSVIRRRP